jgi:hypothetical protein
MKSQEQAEEDLIGASSDMGLLKQRLLSIESAGDFEPETQWAKWATAEAVRLLLDEGRVLRPDRVRNFPGAKLRCHQNALIWAGCHPGVVPWFGFRCIHPWWVLGDEARLWWVHSWCVDLDGTVLDSERELGTFDREWGLGSEGIYYGVPWTAELYTTMLEYQERRHAWIKDRIRECQQGATL